MPRPAMPTFLTPRQVLDNAPDVKWIAKPYLAEGGVTELVGQAKAAGKSTFVREMVRAICEGGPFLGEETCGPVAAVYLTEENLATLAEGITRSRLDDVSNLYLLPWSSVADQVWSSVCQLAVRHAKEVGAKALIVDTLPQFALRSQDAENDAGAALAAMRPLQRAAAQAGLGVLYIRHTRKAGGSVGIGGRGSGAYAGAADILITLQRVKGGGGAGKSHKRKVLALSRFSETPEEQLVSWNELDGYTVVDAAERSLELADWLLASLEKHGAQDIKQLIARSEYSRSSLQRAANQLVKSGQVVLTGEGTRGHPKKLTLPDSSDQ